MEESHLSPDSFTLESAGVDWLTATAYRTSGRSRLHELGNDLIAERAAIGHEVRHWKGGGYHGRMTDGVSVGVRHDTWIVRLSSDCAAEHWREVKAESTNVTRADVQLTFRLHEPDAGYFARQRELATTSRHGRGRRANVTIISSTLDGDSVYLGKRTSDLYGRVYDKGRESKSEKAGLLIRHEVEAKRKAVNPILDQIEGAASESTECARIVASYMRRFCVQSPAGSDSFPWGAHGKTAPRGAGCLWLEKQCAPTVQRLVNCGRLSEVLRALKLDSHVTINPDYEALCNTKEN